MNKEQPPQGIDPTLEKTYLKNVAQDWEMAETDTLNLPPDHPDIPLTSIYLPLSVQKSEQQSSQFEQEATRPQAVTTSGSEPFRIQPFAPVFNEQPYLVLLGGAGTGKSTTLKYLALHYAQLGLSQATASPLTSEDRIPVLLPLDNETLQKKGLQTALANEIKKSIGNITLKQAAGLFNHWRDTDRLLVLLDGVDEIPDKRKDIIRDIRRFSQHAGKTSRIVVTSRQAGYIKLQEPFQTYQLKPLHQPDAAVTYAAKWITAIQTGAAQPEDRIEAAAAQLVKTLEATDRLRRIKDNPLLLRLAVELDQKKGADIGQIAHQVDLFQYYLQEVSWERAKQRGATEANLELTEDALETIAWTILTDTDTNTDTERRVLKSHLQKNITNEMLNLLQDKMGLLIIEPHDETLGDAVKFNYKSFMEYFIALRLSKEWEKSPDQAWYLLKQVLHKSDWQEPLVFLVDFLEDKEAKKNATAFIKRILSAHSAYERELHRDLHLAAKLVGTGVKVDPDLVTRIIKQTEWLISLKRQRLAALIPVTIFLLGLILPPLLFWQQLPSISWWLILLYGAGWISVWIVLSKGYLPRLQEILGLPSRLIGEIDYKGPIWLVGVLAALNNPTALKSLEKLALDKEDKLSLRWYAIVHLGESGDRTVIPTLLKILDQEPDSLETIPAIDSLKKLGGEAVVEKLIKISRDENSPYYIRSTAITALTEIGGEAVIAAFVKTLEDEPDSWSTYYEVSEALGAIGTEAAISALIELLNNKNHHGQKRELANVLGNTGSEAAISALTAILQNEDQDMFLRQTIAQFFAETRNKAAIPVLTKVLNEPSSYIVSPTAAEALGDIGAVEAIPDLQQIIEENKLNGFGRKEATIALGKIGDPLAIPTLLAILENNDQEIAWQAAWAIGKIGDPLVIPRLETILLHQEEPRLRSHVAYTLGELGGGALPTLNELLINEEEDWLVRWRAAIALGNNHDPAAIPMLKEGLADDKNEHIQSRSAEVLGALQDSTALEYLRKFLQHEDKNIRTSVVLALGKMDTFALPLLEEVLQDEDETLRSVAIAISEKIGPEATPILERALYDKSEDIYDLAVVTLTKLDTSAIATILDALPNLPTKRRLFIARAARHFGDEGLQELKLALDDKQRRIWAAITLGALQDISAFPPLQRALRCSDLSIHRTTIEVFPLLIDQMDLEQTKSTLKTVWWRLKDNKVSMLQLFAWLVKRHTDFKTVDIKVLTEAPQRSLLSRIGLAGIVGLGVFLLSILLLIVSTLSSAAGDLLKEFAKNMLTTGEVDFWQLLLLAALTSLLVSLITFVITNLIPTLKRLFGVTTNQNNTNSS